LRFLAIDEAEHVLEQFKEFMPIILKEAFNPKSAPKLEKIMSLSATLTK